MASRPGDRDTEIYVHVYVYVVYTFFSIPLLTLHTKTEWNCKENVTPNVRRLVGWLVVYKVSTLTSTKYFSVVELK